jgi:choline dehydrogenase-like flavoprotein
MLLDARRVDEGSDVDCDVCVVGAGAAGITIARELAKTRLRVCVLESGGLDLDADTQALYNGESVGHPYSLPASRLRYFGGTTNHWHGWCRPLDEIDFEPRAGVPHSGWPLARSELDRHYAAARGLCQLRERTFDAADWARITGTKLFRPTPKVESTVFQVSPPTRFGKVYRHDLRRARNVRVLLHANVVRIELDPGGASVRRVRVATLSKRTFAVRARRVVLAAGAIENARLMLASTDVDRRGVGNGNDLVGRFFADHPHITVGSVRFPAKRRASAYYGVHPIGSIPSYFHLPGPHPRAEGMLKTTDAYVRAARLLRCCFVFTDPPVASALGAQVHTVARDVDGGDLSYSRTLRLRVEQAPNRDSRVALAADLDRLGVPKVKLDWRLSDFERRSAARAVAALAEALGASGLGRVNNRALLDEDAVWLEAVGGSHHMGTARMHAEPRQGVVDANCRVHGIPNLYVAGSAVFPTTGYANPTLTIVALALRLAEHLKRGRA